jgi:peptidyl-prolyl cis-trans isomerase C
VNIRGLTESLRRIVGGRIVPAGPARLASLIVSALLATAAVAALATASWSGFDTPWNDGPLPDDAVMRMGDDVVEVAELEARIDSLEALYGVVPPTDADELDDFRRDAAQSLAVSLVIEREAADRGIVVPRKQAESELAKIVSQQLGGDREAFQQYLDKAGLGEDQIIDEITRTLVNQRLFEEVVADVEPATEADAKAEYDERQAEMRAPEKRQLLNIVVETKKVADQVVDQLEGGASFPALAREVSLDSASRESGGDLGLHTADELDPTYSEAAFAAGEGEVFGPVRSQYGWNVGLVQKVVVGEQYAFAEVKQTLVESLTSSAQLDVWRSFLRDALADADVEYADDYRPHDPDSLPSDVLHEESEESQP